MAGADLTGVTRLTNGQLHRTKLSDDTKLPDYLRQTVSVAASSDTAAEVRTTTAEDATAAHDAPDTLTTGDGA